MGERARTSRHPGNQSGMRAGSVSSANTFSIGAPIAPENWYVAGFMGGDNIRRRSIRRRSGEAAVGDRLTAAFLDRRLFRPPPLSLDRRLTRPPPYPSADRCYL